MKKNTFMNLAFYFVEKCLFLTQRTVVIFRRKRHIFTEVFWW